MGKHYGQAIISEVLRMRDEGMTNRDIGEHLGFTKMQIKKLLERYRKNERNQEAGTLLRSKGRPRKQFMTQEEQLWFENKKLTMENELLRAFRHAIGRR